MNKGTLSRRFTLAKRFTSEAVQSASRQGDHALRAISLARDAYLGAAPGDSIPEDGSTLSTVLQQLYSRTVTIGITSLAREHVDAASAASEKLLDLTSESNLARADALEHRGRLCAVSGEYDRAASFFLECLAVHAKLEEDNVTKAAATATATATAASAPAAKAPKKPENHKTIRQKSLQLACHMLSLGKVGDDADALAASVEQVLQRAVDLMSVEPVTEEGIESAKFALSYVRRSTVGKEEYEAQGKDSKSHAGNSPCARFAWAFLALGDWYQKRKQHASSLRYLSLGWEIMEHIFEVSNKSAWLPMLQVSVPAIAAVDPHKAAAAGIKPEFYDSVHDTLVALKAAEPSTLKKVKDAKDNLIKTSNREN